MAEEYYPGQFTPAKLERNKLNDLLTIHIGFLSDYYDPCEVMDMQLFVTGGDGEIGMLGHFHLDDLI